MKAEKVSNASEGEREALEDTQLKPKRRAVRKIDWSSMRRVIPS